ncbi:MAG: SH3 domain-containing protein, partial [Clostridia bacterium]|nr:SH3 domain-containing protein [Clostridia bacterium]
MKRIVALALIMMLLCTSAHALVVEPEEYNTAFADKTGLYAYDGYVLCDSLTLRSKPDINSKSLRSLSHGQKLLISMREGEWYHV